VTALEAAKVSSAEVNIHTALALSDAIRMLLDINRYFKQQKPPVESGSFGVVRNFLGWHSKEYNEAANKQELNVSIFFFRFFCENSFFIFIFLSSLEGIR
jgi:hypothetical protein